MDTKIRWAFMLSGYGQSSLSCFDLYRKTLFESHQFIALITDGQKTPVEDICRGMGMEVITETAKSFDTIEKYQEYVVDRLEDLQIDYIFLLNYHYRIRSSLLDAFPNRIVNVHPSLLPSFKNTRTAIQDAMEYGVRVSGITTHIIDHEIDEGTILSQKPVSFKREDTFEIITQKYRNTAPKVFLETFNLVEKNHHPKNYLVKLLKS